MLFEEPFAKRRTCKLRLLLHHRHRSRLWRIKRERVRVIAAEIRHPVGGHRPREVGGGSAGEVGSGLPLWLGTSKGAVARLSRQLALGRPIAATLRIAGSPPGLKSICSVWPIVVLPEQTGASAVPQPVLGMMRHWACAAGAVQAAAMRARVRRVR